MNIQNFEEIRDWFENGIESELIQDNFCSNRSVFNGRLSNYETVLKSAFNEDCLYLAASSIGEIGNNCFDHNLGYWQAQPGCLFIREKSYCIIADRGRGIKASLSKVYELKKNESQFIDIAFNKVITGRAPEKRGNGLKFAKKNMLRCGIYLYCVSDGEEIMISTKPETDFNNYLVPILKNPGTFTLISWVIQKKDIL